MALGTGCDFTLSGLAADRPAAGEDRKRLYFETDSPYKVWRDSGTAWDWVGYSANALPEVRNSAVFYAQNPTSTTAGIQEAIDDLPAGGGVVFVPAGNYTVETITVKNSVSIIGPGWPGTVLTLADGTDWPGMFYGDSISNFQIQGLRLNGNRAGQGPPPVDTCGVYLATASTNFLARDCYFDDFQSASVGLVSPSSPSLIGCTIHNCGTALGAGWYYGAVFWNPMRAIVRGNWFLNNPNTALDIRSTDSAARHYDVRVMGNSFAENDGIGCHVMWMDEVVIIGNEGDGNSESLIDCRGCLRFTIAGNVSRADGRGIFVGHDVKRYGSIQGNMVYQAQDGAIGSGIQVHSDNGYSDCDITLMGNVCEGCALSGIYLSGDAGAGTNGCLRVIISGNVVLGNTRWGIEAIGADTDYITAIGNQCIWNSLGSISIAGNANGEAVHNL